jgi:hypothetical protein
MIDLEIEATEVAVPKVKKTRVVPIPQGGVSGAMLPSVAKKKVKEVKDGSSKTNQEKEKFNALMDKDLLERAKNISFFTPNLSLTDMVTDGLRSVVEEYERENGGRYIQRTGKLKTGRKPKNSPAENSLKTEVKSEGSEAPAPVLQEYVDIETGEITVDPRELEDLSVEG